MVDPKEAVNCRSPHYFEYARGCAVDENQYPTRGHQTVFLSLEKLRLNHYYTKSEEESRAKWSRARPDTGGERSLGLLDGAIGSEERFSRPDEEILRYVPAVRRRLQSDMVSV
jgi:hypothetical protein